MYERRKSKRNSQFLRRKGGLKHVIEGKREGRIEVIGRRERRNQQILKFF